MKTLAKLLTIIGIISVFLGPSSAKSQIALGPERGTQNITSSVAMALASLAVGDPEHVVFSTTTNDELTSGYTDKNTWFRFHLKNTSDVEIKKVVYFDSPLTGKLTLFKRPLERTLEIPAQSGSGLPLNQRAYPTRLGTFEISLRPHSEAQFYIKRDSHHALNSHVFIADPATKDAEEVQAKAIFFFYMGGILCLVLYNLILGISTAQKDYLLYSAFAAGFAMTILVLHGVMDSYLFPNSEIIFSDYTMFFSSVALLSASLFVERFLYVTKDFKVGYWGLRVIQVSSLATLGGSFFVPFYRELYFLGYWIDISIFLGICFFLFCAFYSLIKKGHTSAYFFIFSWVTVFLGIGIWMASLHGLIRATAYTHYSLLFGNMGEMLILSLGLAYKIKTLNDEKKVALLAAEDKDRYHRLVKVLSHDVANAVSGLEYHSEILKDLSSNDDRMSEHSVKIGKATSHLSEMLASVRREEILFSLSSGTDLHKVDLAEACAEAVSLNSRQLREKSLQVFIDVPVGQYVRANRFALINQVICNLLSNCIKFSDPESRISISFVEINRQKILSITDEGLGILPDQLSHIFRGKILFTSRGTADEKGSGLGTSLVSEYMKLFEGRIEVQSVHRSQSDKSGTTVRLIFKN